MRSGHDFSAEATYRQTRLPVEAASTLLPEAYYDRDYHDLEQDRLWSSSWVCVGILAELDHPGRALARTVAGRSIIIAKNENGGVRGLSLIHI